MKSIVRLFSVGLSRKRHITVDSPGKIKTVISRDDILNLALHYKTPDPQPGEIALNKLLAEIDNKRLYSRNLNRNTRLHYISIAASIIILFCLSLFFITHNRAIYMSASPGQQVSVYLPDSSEVIINSASVISYNPKQWKTKRLVKLDGEAFFRVKKGIRFEIRSKRCITTVLGTSFNIYARESEFKVSCFTGKISVRTKDYLSVQVITPGYETSMDDHNVLATPYKFNLREVATWRKGEFYFHNEPLKNVFDELHRQFNVTITAGDISGRIYTGSFHRNNLESALQLVCIPMQLDYNINGNTVTIKNKVSK